MSMVAKECPMCAETMRLRARKTIDRVPGTTQTKTHEYQEWVCPECDYFEEADEAGERAG